MAELFPQKPPNLPIFYMQLRFGEQEEWVTLNEREYFPISKGLGYRTRFSRLSEIYFISSGMAANFVGAELAEWVAAAYTQKNPGMHPPTAFRIVGANYTIGSRKDLAYWSDPPMDFFAPEQTVVIAEHSYKR